MRVEMDLKMEVRNYHRDGKRNVHRDGTRDESLEMRALK